MNWKRYEQITLFIIFVDASMKPCSVCWCSVFLDAWPTQGCGRSWRRGRRWSQSLEEEGRETLMSCCRCTMMPSESVESLQGTEVRLGCLSFILSFIYLSLSLSSSLSVCFSLPFSGYWMSPLVVERHSESETGREEDKERMVVRHASVCNQCSLEGWRFGWPEGLFAKGNMPGMLEWIDRWLKALFYS